jgi:hypothetical protein
MNIEKAKTVIKIEEDFLPALNKLVADHFAANYGNIPVPVLIAKVGQKNAKIISTENGRHKMVHCFIDLASGDVLKAKSWKAAEHNFTRGNIFADENCSVGKGVKVFGTI